MRRGHYRLRCCLCSLLVVASLSVVGGFGVGKHHLQRQQHPLHDRAVSDEPTSTCREILSSSIAPQAAGSEDGMLLERNILTTFSSTTVLLALLAVPSIAIAADTATIPVTDENLLETMTAFLSSSSTTALSSSSLQESISGFVAGAALSTTKTLVKFPLDTATVRLQQRQKQKQDATITTAKQDSLPSLFQDCYNGVAVTLICNIPAGAVFFAVKDAVKSALKTSAVLSLPKWAVTCIAVGVAQFPYWAVRNPSEVIKVRQQTSMEMEGGNATSAWQVIQQTLQQDGDVNGEPGSASRTALAKDLYTGYWENILYAYPADVLKFIIYEVLLTQGRSNLSPLEGAQAGAVATAMAQLVTTPLDVVRNRLMMSPFSGSKDGNSSDGSSPTSYWDRLVALANDEGLRGLFAGAAPRVGKAILSGAIQFATYEETKQSILKLLMGAAAGGGDGGAM